MPSPRRCRSWRRSRRQFDRNRAFVNGRRARPSHGLFFFHHARYPVWQTFSAGGKGRAWTCASVGSRSRRRCCCWPPTLRSERSPPAPRSWPLTPRGHILRRHRRQPQRQSRRRPPLRRRRPHLRRHQHRGQHPHPPRNQRRPRPARQPRQPPYHQPRARRRRSRSRSQMRPGPAACRLPVHPPLRAQLKRWRSLRPRRRRAPPTRDRRRIRRACSC